MCLGPLHADDLTKVLALNNAAVPAVNPHDRGSLRALVESADRCWTARVEGELVGVLVAFAPGADYQSANYRWLSDRFDNFRYVDRIIVSPQAKGRGVGRALYAALEQHARAADAPRLVCEVNVEPPNPQSIAFHLATGWVAIEDREFSPDKVVRYFEKSLA